MKKLLETQKVHFHCLFGFAFNITESSTLLNGGHVGSKERTANRDRLRNTRASSTSLACLRVCERVCVVDVSRVFVSFYETICVCFYVLCACVVGVWVFAVCD